MTDVVLVHPGAQHGVYGPLGDTLTALEPPTWTRMIGGWLRDRGYSIAIIDQEAERLSAEAVAARVRDSKPKLLAIVVAGHQPSASTQQMTAAGEIVRAMKALDPGQTVIMLGNHPSALPVRTLEEEAVDYVCDGEGPVTIAGLLEPGSREWEEDIPGLVWRDAAGKIIANKRAPLIPIDELHGDVWDLLPMGLYRAHQWQCFGDLAERQPYASIYTTLGCPYKCSFCMINTFQHTNKYRMRSPEAVVNQIAVLYREYGVKTIKIADEMFCLNRAHVTEICERLIASGIAPFINLWAYARIDSAQVVPLDLLRRAGIRWLALGIESGSKHVRDGADKALKNDDIIGVVRAIQAAGINVIGNYMFGLPDDTLESMQETLDLATDLNTEFGNFYCLPPGTPVYVPEGFKAIEEIKEGDVVLSNIGQSTVRALMARRFTGVMYTIRPRYLPPVQVTDEHPILVASLSRTGNNTPVVGVPRWVKPADLKPYVSHREPCDCVVVPKVAFDGEYTDVDFSPYVVGQVGPGRAGGQLGPVGRKLLEPWPMTLELAELFGWYVAEGSRFSRTNNQLGFSLGANEPENVERVIQLVGECFGYKTQVRGDSSITRIGFVSKVMMRALPAMFGDTSDSKRIPEFIMRAPPEIALAFLTGYVAGDGTSHPNANGQYSLSTASYVLGRQLISLFLKVGKIVGYCEVAAVENHPGPIPRRGKQYKLSWTATECYRAISDDTAFYIPIKSVTSDHYAGPVYNIETTDNTYAVPFVVHNCTMAYPGSRLYTEALETGKTLPSTWRGYSQHNADCRPLDTEHVSAKEVLAFRDRAFDTYFTNPAYLAMVGRKFGAATLAHVQDMVKYRLPRKLLTGEIS